ncbi:6321_t:CDS:2 [Ambispora gerdemannii]|uniref:Probable acetate kinase n=1 Tax=Ambispora gerdemannii TaxID=144530 RepID=A0A9N8V0K8_9GLOM|nr:6321_t:CDS:2 [Ambispora gerdemannii]
MSNILALNAGSSSLKYKIYIYQNAHENNNNKLILLSKGQVTEIGCRNSEFSAKLYSSSTLEQIDRFSQNIEAPTHEIAFTHVLSYLLDKINHLNECKNISIAHRVVHGATEEKPMIISSSDDHSSLEHALKKLDSLSELAPLHNHTSVLIIRKCLDSLPTAKNYIFFDTIFHRTLPKEVYTYALPYEKCQLRRIRKYGFHGLSHSYVTQCASAYLGVDWKSEEVRFISLHLGSGASVCAVRGGKSIDTSMGLTPLEGLPGITRAGTVDPCAIFHLSDLAKSGVESRHPTDRKFHLTEAESILNHDSGIKGICGISNFAEITKIINDKERNNEKFERAKLAFDLFVDRILHFIGAYYVTLEGKVTGLLFTGGIGEHCWEIRETVCERLKCLGVGELDKEKNQNADKEFAGGKKEMARQLISMQKEK